MSEDMASGTPDSTNSTFRAGQSKSGLRGVFLALIVLGVFLLAHIFRLDEFVTVDEATWVMRSANFYYALSQREYEQTLGAYHPAVTTMWIGALATWIEFPEYRGQGQGYFIKEWKFGDFLAEYGHHPLEILKTARLITVLLNCGLTIWIYFLARSLLDDWAAFGLALVLSLDPFLLGHTRILAHEGMLSLLMVLSIFSLLVFIERPAAFAYLAVSAIAASLAALTKSSGIILAIFAGALLFWRFYSREGAAKTDLIPWKKRLSWLLSWLFMFILTYALIWPGMWAAPGEMLYQVYGNAANYFFAGRNFIADPNELDPGLPSRSFGIWLYLVSFLWHSTPLVWLGLIAAMGTLFFRSGPPLDKLRNVALCFFLFGAAYLLIMGLAGGRKSAHYIMFTQASMAIGAVLGIYLVYRIFQSRMGKGYRLLGGGLVIGLLVWQSLSALPFRPYFFNYRNPLMDRIGWADPYRPIGYGEALELAARYITRKPDAEKLTVLSWYGIGSFSYFFPGHTELISPGPVWSSSLVERLEDSDYLVIYYDHQLRRDMPARLLLDLQGVDPETSITLNEVEYVRIFKTLDLPESVFEPETPID